MQEKTRRERLDAFINRLVPDWHPTEEQVLWAVRIIIALVVLLVVVLLIGVWLWGVLDDYIKPKTPTEKKDLVNVIVVLAAGVVGTLTAIAAVGNLIISRRNLENARATLQQQRDLDARGAQDDTLQAYIEQMLQLFLDRSSHEEGESEKVRTLVRARTFPVLKVLDAERNKSVLSFLIETELLGAAEFKRADLEGADLRGANLRGVDLSKANLRAANLSEAKLWDANLENADLSDANLNNAELPGANLRIAKLENADLRHTDLRDADLSTADLRKAKLEHANLSGADMEATKFEGADLSYADLRPSHLRVGETLENTSQRRWERSISGLSIEYERSQHDFLQAELSFATLIGANLKYADLRYANLYETDLKDADLTGANLQGATARVRAVVRNDLAEEPIDEEEREIRADLKRLRLGSSRPVRHLIPAEPLRQARSLKDATMPEGQKYEDWLEDRNSRKEDGVNE